MKSGKVEQMQDLTAGYGSANLRFRCPLFATGGRVFTTRTVKPAPDTEQRRGDLVEDWDDQRDDPAKHFPKQRPSRHVLQPHQASGRVTKLESAAVRRRKI